MQPVSVDDLRARARVRTPRFAFDYFDGGAGTEAGLARNCAAFRETLFHPRVLVNTDGTLETGRRFLGHDWALPFGVAPMGLAAMAGPGTDAALARAAQAAKIPYVAATPASASLEDLKEVAPDSGWFQLYVGKDAQITDDLIARARHAGYSTLVVTADVPRPGKRRRDLRNGFALPLRMGPRMLADLALHPVWALATLRAGAPRFANLERYAETGASAGSLAQFMAAQSSGRLDWPLMERIRADWPGQIVLKGVLHPDDAVRAASMGIDAVQVSSHGGRQLDGAVASLDALRDIRAAVGAGFPLAMDGGVRSGEDILKALDAGADFVFLGRPFLYAVAALGPGGTNVVVDLLATELVQAMAMTGRRSLPTASARALSGAVPIG